MAIRAADLGIFTALWLFLGAGFAAGPVDAGVQIDAYPFATDARVAGDDSQTRFVMDLSKKVELHAFTLADPYRVVIDLPQVTFNLPAKIGQTGRGLVTAFRYGLVMQGGSRIVLDVSKPVRIEKAFVVDPAVGQPARLVLDLAATDRDSFMRTLAAGEGPPRVVAAAVTSEREASPRGDSRPIVVLDPGHGGLDFGTVSSGGIMEKDIVLQFGRTLRDLLEKTGKYRVVMTRSDDTFIPLGDRVRMARIRQAALFISIHADYLQKREGDAQGATIYTLSDTASDAEAARLADDENRADVIAGIDLSHEPGDVADILIDLAQRETKAFSTQFARELLADMKKVARMHKTPLKSAGFKVLKAPDVPAVLLELGYVSNKADLAELTSSGWQAKTAGAIRQAIDAFFATRVAGAGARDAR